MPAAPFARPYFRRRNSNIRFAERVSVAYTPRQVARLYNFPLQYTGAGRTVGIIELGGGISASDLQRYFAALGLPTPGVTAVSVDGGQNQPGSDADGEVMLDIEVVGAVAPGAAIRVYFAPNTSQSFTNAVQAAVNDGCDAISISWGGPSDSWSAAERQAMDAVFQRAAQQGIVVLAAAGDNGSGDGEQGDHVDFPAESPNCLACGGTRLMVSAAGAIAEQVWNDASQGGATGGGVSVAFPRPIYQQGVRVPGSGRVVPDWAGNADPATGYVCIVDGQQQVIGGTSAVAPLYAGLVALLCQALGRKVGPLAPTLYAHPEMFRDITVGSNGDYAAAIGFDPCTGLGVVDGSKLLAALQAPVVAPPPSPPPVIPPPAVPTFNKAEFTINSVGKVTSMVANGATWAPVN